ncbi:EbsC protein [Rhodococcus sp. Leaf7]|uniref:YbaK/EbsC family protein n=1 Tax=unclassified Rhodococcus (in: high G+C Gram-positive bacteria) TaxID=192944 RepID=UPI0005ABDC49|nr:MULTISPECIES: YbaK/EbsC family protein [unclassified Rhodococcus (in: high G+C Gram-positive bacteria)]KIQ18214.1 YbaK/EbsC family protein EbsC protein [Rhodococcus sp. MEB064]KQU07422.1 EbsC protein [Rhodococcus sp. Leaf7]KQU42942.1 EbsC protein [Rhodococcus sp. Leaf247]
MTRIPHPGAAHVADVLISRGHHGVVVTRPEPMHTARQAAAASGIELGAVTKSLVMLLDDDPVLFLVSGAHNVDLDATGRRVEGILTRAPRDVAEDATGQPVGGIAPVGHPTNLPTYVDTALAAFPQLWAAAGHPNTTFRTTYSELLRITAGLAVDVGPDV